MFSNPKSGTVVIIWYAKAKKYFMPHHGKSCVVLAAGKGKPRNHLVEIVTGEKVIIPCGNLIPITKQEG